MSEGYTLEIVVNQFADRYYRLLCTQPADLHRFYLEKSTFSVGDEGEVGTSVSGQDKINEKIVSMNPQGSHVKVTVLDAQPSVGAGLVVMVVGYIQQKDGVVRKFVQSFFLTLVDSVYYILNDTLRYLADPPPVQSALPAAGKPTKAGTTGGKAGETKSESAGSAAQAEPAVATPASPAPEAAKPAAATGASEGRNSNAGSNANAKAGRSSNNNNNNNNNANSNANNNGNANTSNNNNNNNKAGSANMASAGSSNASGGGQTMTYAQMAAAARANNAGTGSGSTNNGSGGNGGANDSGAAATHTDGVPAGSGAGAGDGGEGGSSGAQGGSAGGAGGARGGGSGGSGGSNSLYVGNLPEGWEESRIEKMLFKVFGKYGEVTNVQIRRAKTSDTIFAFVDYSHKSESARALRECSSNHPTIDGVEIVVEARKGAGGGSGGGRRNNNRRRRNNQGGGGGGGGGGDGYRNRR